MTHRNPLRALEEYSAKALGLADLRAGIQEVRDNSGATSIVCVDSIWILRIIPFRAQRGFITIASSGSGGAGVDWRRAVVGTAGAQVVRDISDDPVAKILTTINVLANPMSSSKDGIGYELIVSTPATHATIHFSNPSTEPWRSLEFAALRIATQLLEFCESENLQEFVSTWRRYCERPV